jgi:hypothetical protein
VEAPSGTSHAGPDDVNFALSLEHRRMFGDGYKSFTQGRLGGEMLERDQHGPAVFVFGGLVELDENSLAHEIVHDPAVIGFGLGYRYYFTRKHTFIRPYASVEGEFLWMAWRYRNAIISGDETIKYDSTEGADGYVGLGLILGSNKFMNFFGEIGAGGGFFLGTTDEGLENDIFDPYGYIGVRVGLRFRF